MSLIETLGINVVLLSFLMYIDFNYFNFNFNFITTLIALTLTLYLPSFTVYTEMPCQTKDKVFWRLDTVYSFGGEGVSGAQIVPLANPNFLSRRMLKTQKFFYFSLLQDR